MNLLTEKEVIKKLGVSRTQVWKWRKSSSFPKPRNIAGIKKNVWVESEVETWLENNLEAA